MKKLFLLFSFLALSFTFASAASFDTTEDETVIVDTINDLDLVLNAEFEKFEKPCFIQANEKAVFCIYNEKALAQKELLNIIKNSEAPPLMIINWSGSNYANMLNTSSGGLPYVSRCNSII